MKPFRLFVLCATIAGLTAACETEPSDSPVLEDTGTNLVPAEYQPPPAATCLAAAAGQYCGNDMMSGAVATVLYTCPGGANRAPTSSRQCSEVCGVMPAGQNDRCLRTVRTTTGNQTILAAAVWDPYGSYDGYNPVTRTNLTALSTLAVPRGYTKTSSAAVGGGVTRTRIYDPGNPTVPNGQCVDLVKALSLNTSASTTWIKGPAALASANIGDAVATFSGAAYSGHAGFVCAKTPTSLTLCDSNWGLNGLMQKHTISSNNRSVSDPTQYYVVRVPE